MEAAVSSGSTLGLELGGRDGKPDPKVQDTGTVPKAAESHHSCRLTKAPDLFSPCCVERGDEKSLLTPADPCHPEPSINSLTRWQVWRSQGSPEGGLLCPL